MSDLIRLGEYPLLRGLAAAVTVYLLLLAIDRRKMLSRKASIGLVAAAAIVAGLGVAASAYVTVTNIASPREWDFLCFWLYGRALALGGSPYDVALLRDLAAPFAPSDDFLRVMYCLYPPPCVVQFWPLGLLPISVAAALWYLVQWSALAGIVVLLRRLVDPERTKAGWLVAAALVFALQGTLETLRFAQSNLLIVLLALSSVCVAARVPRGLLLGLAAIVKPLGVLLALQLVVKRQWVSLAAMLVPIAAGAGLFIASQGWTGLAQYRDRNPLAEEIADIYYTERMNQSLLAILLRAADAEPGAHPLAYPPFVALGALMTAITLVVIWRLPREFEPLGLGCSMALALLVYPGTLAHYSVCLLVPLGLLWSVRQRLPGGPQGVLLGSALAYGLVWAEVAFLANLTVWALLLVYGSIGSSSSSGTLTGIGIAD